MVYSKLVQMITSETQFIINKYNNFLREFENLKNFRLKSLLFRYLEVIIKWLPIYYVTQIYGFFYLSPYHYTLGQILLLRNVNFKPVKLFFKVLSQRISLYIVDSSSRSNKNVAQHSAHRIEY